MAHPWIERWQEGRIGWHQETGNSSLRRHWGVTDRTVLVPLCGKTVDMLWLAELGNRVIGIELSDIAIEAFFDEQELAFTVSGGVLRRYDATDVDISIYCGDLFELTSIQCGAHFDRGALIAMPPDIRPAYAAHVSSLLQRGAYQLVITLEYDDAVGEGPPFSLDDREVLAYWPALELVERRDDIDNAPPKFLDAGMIEMFEKVWLTPGK